MKHKRKENKPLLELIRKQRCVACGAPPPSDPDHIKTRGSGGHDVPQNIAPLCRTHHIQRHQYGTFKFAEKYPKFEDWLIENEWHLDEYTKTWRNFEC